MNICDNGLDDGRRCRAKPWRGGYNPLGLCEACLAAYRRAHGDGVAGADGPSLALEPGVRTATSGGERPSPGAGTLGRVLFYDKALGKRVPLEQPPGGVPVLGRDFWVGPAA